MCWWKRPSFAEFKSYYVVWKLFYILLIFFKYSLFKSYYVVWKPQIRHTDNNKMYGLNRTMQYGNFIFIKYIITDKESLNRTMQYGNQNK